MFQQSQEEPILESLALTTKLQKSLRKMISGQKSTAPHTAEQHRYCEQGTITALQSQIKRLQLQNKELFMDNEHVCRDLIRLKEENRELKKETNQQKKYIHHLQSYNQELKKELIFWMRKPTKSQENSDMSRQRLGLMMTEVLQLRRQNEARESQLRELGQTIEVNQIKIQTPPKNLALNLNSIPSAEKPKRHNRSKTFQLNQRQSECTSCNYYQLMTSQKKLNSTQYVTRSHKRKTQKKLCECHRQFLQTSQFKC